MTIKCKSVSRNDNAQEKLPESREGFTAVSQVAWSTFCENTVLKQLQIHDINMIRAWLGEQASDTCQLGLLVFSRAVSSNSEGRMWNKCEKLLQDQMNGYSTEGTPSKALPSLRYHDHSKFFVKCSYLQVTWMPKEEYLVPSYFYVPPLVG